MINTKIKIGIKVMIKMAFLMKNYRLSYSFANNQDKYGEVFSIELMFRRPLKTF